MPDPSVYIETTIVSYITAWPSRDVVHLAQEAASLAKQLAEVGEREEPSAQGANGGGGLAGIGLKRLAAF